MVENLQDLCADVDADFDWQLRKVLQSEPRIMLLATATSRFDGLDDAKQPFFELFRIIDLKPLNTEECRRMWHMISGNTVSEREIRPLEILTGGSPRLLVIIGEYARHQSLRQLMEGLVKLIDDHTEYFRGHLDSFAKTERRVFLAVIDLWQPSTTAEIAARARMDVRTVSALLGRLVEQGVLIVDKSQRKRRYATAERLYSIYYKLRRQRDEAAVVHHLINFMAVFYHGNELAELFAKLRLEARESLTIHEGIQRAIAETPQLADAFELKEFAAPEDEAETLGSSVSAARQLVNKGIVEGQLGQIESEVATYDEIIERFGGSDAPELQEQVARALVIKGLTQSQIGEHETAITTFDEAIKSFVSSDAPELQEKVAMALVFKGTAQGEVGEHEMAIATYDKVIELFGGSDASELQQGIAMALVCKGVAQGGVGEDETAITTYDEVIERFGRSDVPALQTHAGAALLFKSEKQIEIGRAAEALDASSDLENRFGALPFEPDITFDWEAKRTRIEALLALNSCPAAIDVYCKIYASLIPGNRTMIRHVGTLAIDMIAAGASVRHLIAILSSNKNKADALKPLVVALHELAGDSIDAPAEILDVAADIRKAIAARRTALESR